jgi:predicted Zn-dependent peptidase
MGLLGDEQREFDGRGGAVVSASLNTLSRHLEPSLELLFELLAAPAFQPAALLAEQRALGEAAARRNDDLGAVLERE